MASLFSVIQAVVVRCLLVTHATVCIWYVTYRLQKILLWLLMCLLAPLIIESGYTIIRRRGRDFARFTPCFLFYLGAVLPGIWLLELERTEMTIEGRDMQEENSYDPTDIRIPGATQNVWLIVIEELMPYVIFISRWIIPRGTITRKELAELLISFIEIGTDIMEFFALIGQEVIRGNVSLVCAVLALWSFAVLQFTMTITVVHSAKRKKADRSIVAKSSEDKRWHEARGEIYAIFLSIVMQDLPFVVMRLYLIIRYNLIDYSLVFFTCKNLLKIVLLLYKAAVCFIQYRSPDLEKEHGDNKVKVITALGKGKTTGNGNIRKNSFAGSLNMFNLNRENGDFYLLQTQYTGDSELGVKKRNVNSKLQYHTSKDKEQFSSETKDALFLQYEHPQHMSCSSTASSRPNGFGYFSESDIKHTQNSHKFLYRNNKKSPKFSREFKSSVGEMADNHSRLALRSPKSLVPAARSHRHGVSSNLGQTPQRVGVGTHDHIPITTQEQLVHSIPYLDQKKRHRNRNNPTPYPTHVYSSEDIFGHIPIYTNSSLHSYQIKTPMMLLPDAAFGWSFQELPMTDYDIYFSDHLI